MEYFKNSQGLNIEYKIIGEGIPFVFLHGLGGNTNQFESIYQPIKGLKCILLNQQGHGKSEVDYNALSFDRMGDDIIELLDYLHIEKAYFSGISMGAAVSLNVLTRYSNRVIKALLIRNAWINEPIREEIQNIYSVMAEGLKRNDIDYFMKSEEYLSVTKPSEYTRKSFLIPFDIDYNVKYYQKYLVIPKLVPIKSIDDLNNIETNVAIVACRGDLCHPYKLGLKLHELIKGSEFIEIPNKDEDVPKHNQLINECIQRMVSL